MIASSPTDVGPALKAIVESACEICDAYDAVVLLKDGGDLIFSAHHGPIPFNWERWPINRQWVTGRAVLEKATQHVHDVLGPEGADLPDAREIVRLDGHRTVLSVPLLPRREKPSAPLCFAAWRCSRSPRSRSNCCKTFADQAVIAIENVRLFDEVQARTRELSQSLDDLRTAQDRLVQTEKLASLGQLTAGIAHEIKNPLNFVNNFSALSVELIDELNDILKQAELEEKMRREVDELTQMLKSNLEKVVQHGKRANSIVKNMLLHSREGRGERRTVDINALVEESLNLAYHGARAEKPGFNITLERDFDPAAGSCRRLSAGDHAGASQPDLQRLLCRDQARRRGRQWLRTDADGDHTKSRRQVEIRIRDNGTGIPPEVKDKMFNPFFTTKPAGEGTGLGLSMSHDIVVKQHGGTIDVETEPGAFTEIIVTLPRATGAQNSQRGTT